MNINLIIILIFLTAGSVYANPKDSTSDSAQLLPTINISSIMKKHISCRKISCGSCCDGYMRISNYRSIVSLSGTRNLNYYINFVAKNTSIGFASPHINGARVDGNAIFINGIRMDDVILLDLRP